MIGATKVSYNNTTADNTKRNRGGKKEAIHGHGWEKLWTEK